MNTTDLTRYDIVPEDMRKYLANFGAHFNKKLCEFAVSKMRKDKQPIKSMTKNDVDVLLLNYGVKVNNNILYDQVFVANMTKADNWGGSVTSDEQLALRIKEYLDDEDGYDGIAFNRWLADCARKGVIVDWESMV